MFWDSQTACNWEYFSSPVGGTEHILIFRKASSLIIKKKLFEIFKVGFQTILISTLAEKLCI